MDVVQILSPPRGEPLTWRDLEDRPDDGRRYELIDGVLIVTPAPAWFHQRAVAGLYRTMYAACPADLEVLFAPLDVRLAEDTVLQPDLLVVRIAEMTQRGLIGHEPVLAVEVLSPPAPAASTCTTSSRGSSAQGVRRTGWSTPTPRP